MAVFVVAAAVVYFTGFPPEGAGEEVRKDKETQRMLAFVPLLFAMISGMIWMNSWDTAPKERFAAAPDPAMSVAGVSVQEICVNGFAYMLAKSDDGSVSIAQVMKKNSNNMGSIPKTCEEK